MTLTKSKKALSLKEILTGKKSDEDLYTRTDIDNIFQHIISTGILDNVDASQASSIGQTVKLLFYMI